MPKRTKKLLVYLDQNFISNMAKADVKKNVPPEFKEIYELLHQGFVDEKLLVARSLLHDIESSLATQWKDRIVTYQHYLGQVRLYRPDEIQNTQTFAALDRFMGRIPEDPLRPEAAFLHHPDQRVERFASSVDSHLERHNFRQSRHRTAKELEQLRQRLLRSKVTYDQQLKVEQETQRNQFVQTYCSFCGPISEEKRKELTAFTESTDFTSIPLLRIEAHLFASILTRKPNRQIKRGDVTDIEALSAYAPYMDVVCTDAFMVEQLQTLDIDKEHQVAIFNAKNTGRTAFKAFLEDYLKNAAPIRRPAITAFVLPSDSIKEHAFKFFYNLGAAAREFGTDEYAEIFAFDDGRMPQYECPQLPNRPVPFYGLQDVHPIKLPPGTSHEAVLTLCREHCRSNKFVLIDEWKKLPEHFLLGAAMLADDGIETTDGYRIYTNT
ncbi:MAG: hypothetical protein ABSG25_09580 [Bryobacteraceae bacterium]